MRLGFVLVHYHTAELLELSVQAINRELAANGLRGDVVVVDNGSTESEGTLIEQLPVRILRTIGNPGYAAALNLGIAHVPGDVVFLMNPDVLVLPGCLNALLSVLDDGAAVAGPRFFWDEGCRFLLPPTEERSRGAEILSRLASWGRGATTLARRRWRRHARRHWLAGDPIECVSLSGALLAVRREAFDVAGLFDEAFRLYFEETDWLLRVRERGLAPVHVPSAHAVHLFNQSAAQEEEAGRWFGESQRRFEELHYGRRFSRLLSVLQRDLAPPEVVPAEPIGGLPRISIPESIRRHGRPAWIELSPLVRGFPAAAARIDAAVEEWTLPEEIWDCLAPGCYYVRLCSESGRDLLQSAHIRLEGAREAAKGPGTGV